MLETKLAVDVKRIGHNIPQDLHVLEPPQGQYFSLEKHIVPACAGSAHEYQLVGPEIMHTHTIIFAHGQDQIGYLVCKSSHCQTWEVH